MTLIRTLATRLAIFTVLIAAVAGCYNSSSSNGEGTQSALPGVISVPAHFVMADETYRYFPISTGTNVTWSIDQGPYGLEIIDGHLEWTPAASDVGEHRVVLRATAGNLETTQSFSIVVATRIERASGDISSVSGGTLSVSAPLSAIRGVAITVQPNALTKDTKISINEISAAPAFPGTRTAIKAVEFRPSGLSFQYPAIITLPFDNSGAVDVSKLMAAVYNEDSGRWEPIEVISIDLENGVLQARASHFSIYAAAESAVDYQLRVEAMDGGSTCEGRLAARGELTGGIATLDTVSVSNLSESLLALAEQGATTVRQLIDSPGFSGSLRFVRFFTLTSSSVTSARKALVVTIYAPGDSSATVTATDSFGNVIFQTSYADISGQIEAIDADLSGLSTHAFFDSGFGVSEFQVSGRLHVIYSVEDQSLVGADGGSLGSATVEVPAASFGSADPTVDGFDVDCDRHRGGYDTFDNSLEPKIVASPTEAVSVMQGTSVKLAATVTDSNNPPTSTSWEVIAGDASATLTPVDGEPSSRSFLATVAGFYTVSFTATVDNKTLKDRFNIQVRPKPVANTPPTCLPTALRTTADVGETVTLFAAVEDAQTPSDELTIAWGLAFDTGSEVILVPSASISGEGVVVGFSAASAGSHTIGCRAYDGDVWGEVGATTVGVVAAEVNQAPVDFVVSPPSGQVIQGESLTFKTSATDADGDTLIYSWIHPFGSAVPSSGSSITISTADMTPGSYSLLVSVSDGDAPAQYLPASLRVLAAPIAAEPVDNDGDGFPVGIDCDDQNNRVHPDAHEVCGNSIDEDCDGVVRQDDCDNDGFTVSDGDCNDANPSIHPSADEVCDGVDNNCEGTIDEGYVTGSACSAGLGVCENNGVKQCSADRLRTLCSVTEPNPSSAEICDALDNNCDGRTDEGFYLNTVCTVGIGACAETGLTSCGESGSNTVCSAVPGTPTEEVYDKIDNDCNGQIDEGLTPPPELCDGLDNDYDGQVDEDFSLGGTCSVGVGACVASGQFVCSGDGTGTTCDAVAGTPGVEVYDGIDNDCDGLTDEGVTPFPELCDGLDNDLDGQVDEDFSLGGTCSVGVGACVASGQLVCSGDGTGTTCDAVAGTPSVEVYDGIDNDCDGLTDEGVTPPPELCDGLDNDLDGQVDEDFSLGGTCLVGVGACAAPGQYICSGDGTSTTCDAVAGTPGVEICDGIDNDCDGAVDEDNICGGGGGVLCGDYSDSTTCEGDTNCYWNFTNSICETLVTATCETYATEPECIVDVYCEWDTLNTMCVGYGTSGGGGGGACADYLDEPSCLNDTTCAWDLTNQSCFDLGGASCDNLNQTECEAQVASCLWNPSLQSCVPF